MCEFGIKVAKFRTLKVSTRHPICRRNVDSGRRSRHILRYRPNSSEAEVGGVFSQDLSIAVGVFTWEPFTCRRVPALCFALTIRPDSIKARTIWVPVLPVQAGIMSSAVLIRPSRKFGNSFKIATKLCTIQSSFISIRRDAQRANRAFFDLVLVDRMKIQVSPAKMQQNDLNISVVVGFQEWKEFKNGSCLRKVYQ